MLIEISDLQLIGFYCIATDCWGMENMASESIRKEPECEDFVTNIQPDLPYRMWPECCIYRVPKQLKRDHYLRYNSIRISVAASIAHASLLAYHALNAFRSWRVYSVSWKSHPWRLTTIYVMLTYAIMLCYWIVLLKLKKM